MKGVQTMARTLAHGEREVMAELQADCRDGWYDEAVADDLDLEAESRDEFQTMMDAEFDLMHAHLEAQTRLQQEDEERIAALLHSNEGQVFLWGDAA